ncbi:RNA polymerase, sigma-24 subunit, ECF subfamily [Bacteroides coprosuis DSM 18011]|uniref:RNA polymerase, sigma-24 subunit, ECF subfamily n=1 Tax=Bacteroides coprosuis DSM 18011 TaxID=679937 RepID=F3ZSY0_9BACE|nr:sigma-70 family RNA polymerase sigma factor [Bacteroides coprosuis]EGJ72221.1 RNA polymerase, sigma-24 subunit, ECF subfamily [Bacteroides coprosuis DSM 18011]
MKGDNINSTEAILIRQLKKGSQLAFSSLYEKYSKEAYMLSLKYLCSKELAEDAVQNLFIKIWVKKKDIDENKPFNRYLFTILKNDLLNTLRDSQKNVTVLEDCLEMLLNLYASEEIEEVENNKERQLNMIKKAVAALSSQRQRIFLMKYSGKYTNQEIADILNLSINTIKYQYYQSLKQIRSYVTNIALLMLFNGTL